MKNEKIRMIKAFGNRKDVVKELSNHLDVSQNGTYCVVNEKTFLMNVANIVCCYILEYEAGEMPKDELDVLLRKTPLPVKALITDSPVDFNFVIYSRFNKRIYTGLEYNYEDVGQKDVITTNELYHELSNMYSFDAIIDKIQKMVADFKAANPNFDKMTLTDRVTKFRSWNGNEDYINNNFLVKLL